MASFQIIKYNNDTLSFSAIGYQELKLHSKDLPLSGLILLTKKNEVLGDVQIKVKKRRRKRKQDKAYILHQAIAKNRINNDLKKKPYYDCEVYNKIEIDLNTLNIYILTMYINNTINSIIIFPPIIILK